MFKKMGTIFGAEFEMLCRDGTLKIVSFDGSIGHGRDGSFRQTHCVFSDISERKRVEKALKLAQFSVNKAGDAVCWIGADARFLYVNEAKCRTYGYTEEDFLSMTVHGWRQVIVNISDNYSSPFIPWRYGVISRGSTRGE